MMLWLILSIGTALSLLAIALLVAMARAERRARKAFYRSLGYGDEVIGDLKLSKGYVAEQLAQLRQASSAIGPRSAPGRRDGPPGRDGAE